MDKKKARCNGDTGLGEESAKSAFALLLRKGECLVFFLTPFYICRYRAKLNAAYMDL